MFADGKSAVVVAALLEVSTKSAYQWRRAWVAGGAQALASKGPSGPEPKLSDEQLARLKARLEPRLCAKQVRPTCELVSITRNHSGDLRMNLSDREGQ
jgi:transposase